MHNIIKIMLTMAILTSFLSTAYVVISEETPQPYIYNYAPVNSFGATESKTVNWTFFKQFFNDVTSWKLEYKRYSYSAWVDGSQYLTIQKTWNETGFWKFNLILDVPINVYSGRFTFAIDKDIVQYVDRSNKYEYWLNYTIPNTNEVYNCMFNWSDIAHISNLIITKGFNGAKYWFRFQRDNIPAGHYEFDPTFGYTVSGSTIQYIYFDSTTDYVYLRGVLASPSFTGVARSISTNVNSVSAGRLVKCRLYAYVDYSSNYAGALIAETETLNISTTGLKTFDFTSYPTINSGTNYYICVYAVSPVCPVTIKIDGVASVASNIGIRKLASSGTLSVGDPLTGEAGRPDEYCYIYCTYDVTPSAPTGFTATTYSTSQINLSWSKGTNATHTRIQRKTGSYPTSISDGTNEYNGTGTTDTSTGLSCNTQYFYRAWSYNSTTGLWSTANASAINTTSACPPAGGTTYRYWQNYTWSIWLYVNGTATFDYNISCHGQYVTGNDVTSGEYSINLTNLTEGNHNIYVNMSDIGGTTATCNRVYKISIGEIEKMEIIFGIEAILLICWLLGFMLVIGQKGITQIMGSLLIAYVTITVYLNYSTIFGSEIFVITGVIISIAGILDFLRKHI